MNKTSFKETRNLRLENPIVVRKVPMTAKGCDMLRAIRNYQVQQLLDQEGLEVEIQFPTSIHMMMTDYCKIKGIDVEFTQQRED